MISFLTSSFIKFQKDGEYVPEAVDSSNHFVENLKTYWKENLRFLLFASDPGNVEATDHMVVEMKESFELAGLPIGEICAFDLRSVSAYAKEHDLSQEEAGPAALREAMAWSDVFFLSGGHCPTELAFLNACQAREAFQSSEEACLPEIFIGLSAGSVNAADDVYLIPELPGESIDPHFIRFAKGLGLTNLQIVPHSAHTKEMELDDQSLLDFVLRPDSTDHTLYLLPDGSYFMIKGGVTELFGTAEVLEDGVIRSLEPGIIVSETQAFSSLSALVRSRLDHFCDSLFSNNYDLIFTVDESSEQIHFVYISPYFQENGFFPSQLGSFPNLVRYFTERLVVHEEQGSVLEQINLPFMVPLIRRDREFVRTIHIDTPAGIQAEKMSARMLESVAPGQSHLLFTLTNIASIVDHDVLTDEYSRSGFLSEASRVLRSSPPEVEYAVVYTNIPGFKAINDLFGTLNGDFFIFQSCKVLREYLQPAVLARLESDHFALLAERKYLAEENLNKLNNILYLHGSMQYHFPIHCGIYYVTGKYEEVVHMLDCAQLVEKTISSDRSKTYAVYDEDMRTKYLERSLFVSELETALKHNDIFPYFQPVVDAKTGEIFSAEALVRWEHPEMGMVSPGRFVPALEETGNISKIDYHMISSVIAFNQVRKAEGLKIVPCAVNLSRIDFYDSKLVEMIEELLEKYPDLSDMIKFEVTESAYTELEQNALDFLTRLQQKGISILLDDYGSGMSSIATLESFSFDILKLDMGFVRKIGKSRKAEAIIRSTIEMAHGLGAKVIAEGVEEEEQLKLLTIFGCDYIQGYYFYKPLPQAEFAALLDK